MFGCWSCICCPPSPGAEPGVLDFKREQRHRLLHSQPAPEAATDPAPQLTLQEKVPASDAHAQPYWHWGGSDDVHGPYAAWLANACEPQLRILAQRRALMVTPFPAALQNTKYPPCALQRIQRCKQSLQLNNGRLYLTGARGVRSPDCSSALNQSNMQQRPPACQQGRPCCLLLRRLSADMLLPGNWQWSDRFTFTSIACHTFHSHRLGPLLLACRCLCARQCCEYQQAGVSKGKLASGLWLCSFQSEAAASLQTTRLGRQGLHAWRCLVGFMASGLHSAKGGLDGHLLHVCRLSTYKADSEGWQCMSPKCKFCSLSTAGDHSGRGRQVLPKAGGGGHCLWRAVSPGIHL